MPYWIHPKDGPPIRDIDAALDQIIELHVLLAAKEAELERYRTLVPQDTTDPAHV